MGSCAAPSAKGDDKFITTDYLQQCPPDYPSGKGWIAARVSGWEDYKKNQMVIMK
ncbi:hypothetical protein GV740_09150 [Klebsiella pneumoniae]|nr:hypothetical protein [Klebsiella pneumoniae]